MIDTQQLTDRLLQKQNKYAYIAKQINRYPDWMMEWHSNSTEYDESALRLRREQQARLTEAQGSNGSVSLYLIYQFSKYAKISSPLVLYYKISEDDDETVSRFLHIIKMKNTRLLKKCESLNGEIYSSLGSDDRESAFAWLTNLCTWKTPLIPREELVAHFFEEQQLLTDILLNAKIITRATKIMLAYLNRQPCFERDFHAMTCLTLEEMENLEGQLSNHLATERYVTLDDLNNITEILKSRRSYKTAMSDFFQEALDFLLDLIPLFRKLIVVDRSTTSLALQFFKHAQNINDNPSHANVDFSCM